ncbi:hypothetical protein [Streptomyces uncialis]|uniref:hypothetical protein n=1 Tax=Streptomyces uncialis TaxID=1048205 RepID=UPI00225579D1|nr:hypothetical protein [Streptomyces uncialis]MCX4661513.1 hypothetical protein [Streptomyces uncialis]
MARRLGARLGRRGVALTLLGLGKMLFGLGYALQPDPDPRGLRLLTGIAPLQCWAAVWIVCGAVTAASAWVRVGRDRWGFVAALIPPFLWGSAFLWSAVLGEYARGLAVAGWYATSHVGMILWAATIPEHSVPPPRPGGGR